MLQIYVPAMIYARDRGVELINLNMFDIYSQFGVLP